MASQFQTPPRPGPGNFINTPVPRGNLQPAPSFNATPYVPRQNQSLIPSGPSGTPATIGTSVRPIENLNAAQRTGRAINEAFDQVTRTKSLEMEYVGRSANAYDIRNTPVWAPFQKYKSYNIPDQIFEQFNRAQVATNMGLFAEIHYAWMTVDNALYLWDYTLPYPDLLGFEDQPYSIELVKLAKPKPGVFLTSIKHMIVLATTDQITLLGLGEDPAAPGAGLTLFQTGMSASVKGLHVSNVACSLKSGRVFFGCNTDNGVRELYYQAQDSWFKSRCYIKNHTQGRFDTLTGGTSSALSIFGSTTPQYTTQMDIDDSRNLLYTLSSSSEIRAFYMSPDGTGLEKKAEIGMQRIHRSVDYALQHENIRDNTRIKAISAIGEQETQAWVLMATTAEGYRLYLSGTFHYSEPRVLVDLALNHVRTPPLLPSHPGDQRLLDPQAKNSYLTTVSTAYRFPPGYFFAAIARVEGAAKERLFVSVPDAQADNSFVRPQHGTPESAAWIDLNSQVMDIGFVVPYKGATPRPQGFGYELAVQFDEPVPEVAILTNTGIHVLRRKRFVDSLSGLIREGGGQEGFQNEVQNLIVKYGRQEILADALAVACGQSLETNSDRALRITDPQVIEAARKVFIDHGGRPSVDQNAVTSVAPIDAVRPSPRYEACIRYASRLLRSTWKQAISKEERSPLGYQILSATKPEKLRAVQESLTALQKFFNTNRNFIRGLSGPDDLAKQSSKDEEVALQGEHRALHALVKFISEMIEAISFILVLFEEKVVEIVPLLPEASRTMFLTMTFEQLITTQSGMEVAKDLVKAIVNRNIAKGSNVETIAEALRRKCGNFCSADDVVIFKAQELLKRAAEAQANVEASRISLNESLKLFEQVAKSLPQDYLQSAVKEYLELQFFAGAIQLALKVANERDNTNDAQSWMVDGKPENDRRREKFDIRNRCYDLIHEVLEAIDIALLRYPAFLDGRPSLSAVRRDEAYEVISRSKDEVFLTNLYDWYLSKGWYERLLSTDTNSGFVVTYLERKSKQEVTYSDLLWQYYGKNSQFHEAAKVQLSLAQSTFQLPLDKRLEYLSRARANASAFTTANNAANRKMKQKLLTEINGLIEVTNIQDEILSRLRDDHRLNQGEADNRERVLSLLNGQILTISELFNGYADSAGYYDVCLYIYATADHRDASQIKNTWQQLLEATHRQAEQVAQNDPDNRDVVNPTEMVAEKFREVAARVRSSEAVFPVQTLIEMLERYNVTAGQLGKRDNNDTEPGLEHWIPDIFLELEVSFELLYDSLETIYLASNSPGSRLAERRIILADLLYVIVRWFEVSSMRAGQTLFGGEAGQIRIEELLIYLTDRQTAREVGEAEWQLARRLKEKVAEQAA